MPAARWVQRALALVLLAASAGAWAGPTGEPEPELRSLLHDAIAAADSFDDRFDAEVWLASMSSRLVKRIPDERERLDFLRVLHREATRARIPPELALAVIEVESGFNRVAVSKAGATGYMQIMPFWLKEIAGPNESLLDPQTNLRMGCTILRYYLDREKGELTGALGRYNGSYGRPQYPQLVLNALAARWYR
jgi:soluble lytic murein transglycosylase-like protein